MAQASRAKVKAFFEGRRRRARLQRWEHLETGAGEKRIKLHVLMPLLNHSIVGMPLPVSEAFTVMSADASTILRTDLNMFLEGMTFETFTSDVKQNGEAPTSSSTAAMFDKFSVTSTGIGEKRTVDLSFVVYVPANIQVRDWAWDHLHGEFFLEAVYSQSELELGDADEEDEPEEVEDEEPEQAELEAKNWPGTVEDPEWDESPATVGN